MKKKHYLKMAKMHFALAALMVKKGDLGAAEEHGEKAKQAIEGCRKAVA